MPFSYDTISTPNSEFEINWTFSEDLRILFPEMDNNDISKELVRRGVINEATDEADSESSCTWVYFKTEADANAFIDRINATPEVKARDEASNRPPRSYKIEIDMSTTVEFTPTDIADLIYEHFNWIVANAGGSIVVPQVKVTTVPK